jgi:endonuclease-8
MPEGDTIYRAAATLARALAGETVRALDTPLPAVARAAEGLQIVGRQVEDVVAQGKFLLVKFSGEVTLLSHARMNGSWHIYRRAERWRAPRSAMRVRIATDHWEAVGFSLPIVELHDARSLARSPHLRRLGPDPLGTMFDLDDALERLRQDPSVAISDALVDQRRLAGVGNVLKSEALFLAGLYPFTKTSDIADDRLRQLISISHRLLHANIVTAERPRATPRAAGRNTTGSSDPTAKLWVYGRSGRACRRCGATITFRRSGPYARGTYWCPKCQKP